MTFQFRGAYRPEAEEAMRKLFHSLSEKDRRRYAAAEAQKLGHGGITYLAKVFGCSRDVIYRGLKELEQLPDDPAGDRIRRPGGGRKKTEQKRPELVEAVQSVLEDRTAGDPMRPEVKWTDRTPQEISAEIAERGVGAVSPRIVRRILKELGFVRRKIAKVLTRKHCADRDAQFRYIAELQEAFREAGNPILSMDTKKKEHLGLLYRAGRVYAREPIEAWDHDFPSWAEGKIIPHGLYDPVRNWGCLHLGLSGDTSEFACDSLRLFWERHGQWMYPAATELLLLCDGGGSNSYRSYRFKEDLQKLVNELGFPIRVAHYPAYCSKFNPIERRLFCHVTRACEGVLFDSLKTVVRLMSKTQTRTGLRVVVDVIEKVYETGREATEAFKKNIKNIIDFDEFLPKWNYRVIPQPDSS